MPGDPNTCRRNPAVCIKSDPVGDVVSLECETTQPTDSDSSEDHEHLYERVRAIEGEKGLFVAMPSEAGKDGKWYNTVIPLNRDIKDEIEKVVLEAYGG